MPTVTLGLLDAKEMARALLSHTSRDDVTPVLHGVCIRGQYAFSTDRYTVGRYDLTNITAPADVDVWIAREALAWLRTIGKQTLLYGQRLDQYFVTFITTVGDTQFDNRTEVHIDWVQEDKPDETHLSRVFHARGATGNFPPVHRLLEEFLPGELAQVSLMGSMLSRFTGYAGINTQMRVTLPKLKNGSRVAPLLIEIGTRFKGLIQPNIMLYPGAWGVDLSADNATREAERLAAIGAPSEAPASPETPDGNAVGEPKGN